MPYLKLETNVAVPYAKADGVLAGLSAVVAKTTGKPESVVQVALHESLPMYMAGSDAPAAHVWVKGIDFAPERAAPMSEAVCAFVAQELGISGPRVFITFDSYPGSMWGGNGTTFG